MGPPIGLSYAIGCGAGAGEASPSASPPSSSDSPLGGGGFAGRPTSVSSRRSSPCCCAEAGGGLSRDGGEGALALSQRGVVLAGARASRAPPPSASAPSSASIAAPAASRHARLHLRHRRRLRSRHCRRRRGPQPPHPPRACVVRDRVSSASRSRLCGCAALRSAHAIFPFRAGTSYGRSALGPAQPRLGCPRPRPFDGGARHG